MRTVYKYVILFSVLLVSPCHAVVDRPTFSVFGAKHDERYYKSHPVFTPLVKKEGRIVKFLTPSGEETSIKYDISKLVDIDQKDLSGYRVSNLDAAEEVEQSEKIINTAVTGAFKDGYYADMEDDIKSSAGVHVLSNIQIAKPVEIEVEHQGDLQKMYAVPVLYNDKVAAVAKVGEYSSEKDPIPVSYSIPNQNPSTLEGDGLYAVASVDSVKSELSSGSRSGRYRTLGLSESSVKIKRVYVHTFPKISGSGFVWKIQSRSGTYFMNEDGKLFQSTTADYSVSGIGVKLPNDFKVNVQPIY